MQTRLLYVKILQQKLAATSPTLRHRLIVLVSVYSHPFHVRFRPLQQDKKLPRGPILIKARNVHFAIYSVSNDTTCLAMWPSNLAEKLPRLLSHFFLRTEC